MTYVLEFQREGHTPWLRPFLFLLHMTPLGILQMEVMGCKRCKR